MCNFFIKILCAIVLIIAFVFNTIGNWIGVGDIIPTDKCPCNSTTVTETTTEIFSETTEQFVTVTEATTTQPTTTTTTTKPTTTTTTTQPTTTTTTKPTTTTTTTQPTTTTTTTKPTTTTTTTQPTTTTTTTKPTTTTTTTQPTTTTTTTKPTTTTTTTQPTTTTTTKPTTTTTTTQPTTTTTTKPTTTEEGPFIDSAEENSLSVFGGEKDDIFRGIAPTSDGGFVACGSTSSTTGDFAGLYESGWQTPYSFVIRYNSDGSIKWKKAVGSSSASIFLEDITAMSNGSFIVVGYTEATEYAAHTYKKTNVDAIILKITKNGKVSSTRKSFGGSSTDIFYSVDATSAGLVVGGISYSTDYDFAHLSGSSAILMNLDSNYNVLWKKHLHGSYNASIDGVSVDKDGNIFASCLTSANDGDFAVYEDLIGGYRDTLVLKYNSAGTYQWGYVISTSGKDEFPAIAADDKGGCAVAGYYELMSSSVPDGTLTGIKQYDKNDALVIRLNDEGEPRWIQPIAGFGHDYITDISKTEGGFAVSGYTTSASGDFKDSNNMGGNDGFAAFIANSGRVINVFTQAGTKDDVASNVVCTDDGTIFVLGKTKSLDCDFSNLNSYSSVYTGYVASYKVTAS